jgi:hypothetical protein
MGRTITLAMVVLVVIGATCVVLSNLSKHVGAPAHPLGCLNTNALPISDPNAQFDPRIPSVIGSYDAFGGLIADEPGVEGATTQAGVTR